MDIGNIHIPVDLIDYILSYLFIQPIGVCRCMRRVGLLRMKRTRDMIADSQYVQLTGYTYSYIRLFLLSGRWMLVRGLEKSSLQHSMREWRKNMKYKPIDVLFCSKKNMISKVALLSRKDMVNLVKPNKDGILPEGTKILLLSSDVYIDDEVWSVKRAAIGMYEED